MGLLDGLLGAMGGDGQQTQTDDPKARLIQAALSMLTNQSGAGGADAGGISGLDGLLNQFHNAGLTDVVQTWIGNGQNQAVSPDQVQQALGGGQLEQLAQAAGISPDEAASHLSEILPGLIDKLTPNGQVPAAGGGLGNLAGILGGILGGDKKV